jgi:hypothetical protein
MPRRTLGSFAISAISHFFCRETMEASCAIANTGRTIAAKVVDDAIKRRLRPDVYCIKDCTLTRCDIR